MNWQNLWSDPRILVSLTSGTFPQMVGKSLNFPPPEDGEKNIEYRITNLNIEVKKNMASIFVIWYSLSAHKTSALHPRSQLYHFLIRYL